MDAIEFIRERQRMCNDRNAFLWNYCKYCGKRIEVGEKCYGLPTGESVCASCCVEENELREEKGDG